MIYFSELKGKKVITEDAVQIGLFDDVVFQATEDPKVTKFLVIHKKKGEIKRFLIPISCLKKINQVILVNKNFVTEELVENEIYVVRNLLDKQIIDLKGNKIVRVNDVLLQDENGLYVSGVDIGFLAILRWLGLEQNIIRFLKIFHINIKSRFLSWADIQPLELTRGLVKLRKKEEKLQKMKPEDLAFYLDKTNIRNVGKLLNLVDEKYAASVIRSLNLNYQISIFKHFKIEKVAKIVSLMDPDEAVDVIFTLSKTRQEEILALLAPEKKKEINYLRSLSKTPIGDLITTEYISVSPNFTVKEVIAQIKKATLDFYYFNIVYVVNDNKQLIGVFSLHELILQESDTPVYKFMIQNVIVTHLTTPKEIVFNKIVKYYLHSLPVIDNNRQILGMVTVDDLARSLWKENYERYF